MKKILLLLVMALAAGLYVYQRQDVQHAGTVTTNENNVATMQSAPGISLTMVDGNVVLPGSLEARALQEKNREPERQLIFINNELQIEGGGMRPPANQLPPQ